MIENKENENLIPVINYLVNSLKVEGQVPNNQNHQNHMTYDKPIFLFEFFVFDLYLPQEVIKTLNQPLLAFRLFDFPTQVIEGKLNHLNKSVTFNQGKCSYFEMDIPIVKESLLNQPLYIMLIDMNYGNMKILASSRLNISVFSYDQFIQYDRMATPPVPRRNILKLFDNTAAGVAEFDISLLIRREYFSYKTNDKESAVKFIREDKQAYNYTNDIFNSNKLDHQTKRSMRDEIVQDITNRFKESGVNTISERKLNVRQPCVHDDDSFKRNDPYNYNHTRQSLVVDIQSLLSEKKNPPPLFFHHKRENYTTPPVSIVREETEKIKDDTTSRCVNETNTNFIQIPKTKEIHKENPKQIKTKITNYDKHMKRVKLEQGNKTLNSINSINSNKEIQTPKTNKDNSHIENSREISHNEYLNLFSKIKESKEESVVKSMYQKSSSKSIAKNDSISDEGKYGKFYEISNSYFNVTNQRNFDKFNNDVVNSAQFSLNSKGDNHNQNIPSLNVRTSQSISEHINQTNNKLENEIKTEIDHNQSQHKTTEQIEEEEIEERYGDFY